MKGATTIFYQNSMGFMCQWKGIVIGKSESSIDIRFSKNKACRFNLKESGFLLVTNTPVKSLGVCVSERSESISFDDSLIEVVKSNTAGNVAMAWNGSAWA